MRIEQLCRRHIDARLVIEAAEVEKLVN